MTISRCLIAVTLIMVLISPVYPGSNKPSGLDSGPSTSPQMSNPQPHPSSHNPSPPPLLHQPSGSGSPTDSGRAASPNTATPKIVPSASPLHPGSQPSPPVTQKPATPQPPSAANSAPKPGAPTKQPKPTVQQIPSTPKPNSNSLSPSQQADLTNRNSTHKYDQASLTEYYAKKQSIDRNYDNKLSELNKTKSGMSQDQFNSKVKSISNDRDYYHSLNEATIKKQSQGHSPETTRSYSSGGSNPSVPGSPPGSSIPDTKSNNPPGSNGSSGSAAKKSSPNQETLDGPYWQRNSKQIENMNNQQKALDAKQKALGEKAGQNHWSPAATAEHKVGMAVIEKERSAIYQKYKSDDASYIKANYPDYYAKYYAGKSSPQSLPSIPLQNPGPSRSLVPAPPNTTPGSSKAATSFDSSIWPIEKSLQEGRPYWEAPWHNKTARQWELQQKSPWHPDNANDPARVAAQRAIDDQYKRELGMSKSLERRSRVSTDKAPDFTDPVGKFAVYTAAMFVEVGRSMATAINLVLPKDKELPIWDHYMDKDGAFKDWPH